MIWHVHFLMKVLLALQGTIHMDAMANLALAAGCYWPIEHPWRSRLRHGIALAAALLLLAHEGSLPHWSRWSELLRLITEFSWSYWRELFERFATTTAALSLVAVVGLVGLLSRRYRLEVWILASIAGVSIPTSLNSAWQGHTPSDSVVGNRSMPMPMERFQQEQTHLHMTQLAFPNEFTPDVALLHVCSLSWDDVRQVGISDQRFIEMFDVVLGQFNSATSYSGPAMLRLVNSLCGQAPHDQLYGPVRTECNLLHTFSVAGFGVQAWLNHSGTFDHFGATLQAQSPIRIQTASDFPDLPRHMLAFDGTELIDDEAMLLRWWRDHDPMGKSRVLYYNTISLHDGNRAISPGRDKPLAYAPRLDLLMATVRKLTESARQSRRGLLLLVIPEHGAALRPQGTEPAGLRHTPWPTITHVPVGMVLVSANTQTSRPLLVLSPSSYLSVSSLLGQVLSVRKPHDALLTSAQQLTDIPWVADNGDRLVAWHADQTWILNAQDKWEAKAGVRPVTLPDPP